MCALHRTVLSRSSSGFGVDQDGKDEGLMLGVLQAGGP